MQKLPEHGEGRRWCAGPSQNAHKDDQTQEQLTGYSPDHGSAAPDGGQFDLFDLHEDDEAERPLSSSERFEAFHRDNPQVLARLIEMCRQWRTSTGGQKLGIRTLWETLRWDIGLRTGSADFKLNDHYTSYYVRLIAVEHPDLGELFEMRRSPEADAWIDRRAA